MRARELIQRRSVLFPLIVALLLLGIHLFAGLSAPTTALSAARPSSVPSMVSPPVVPSLADAARQAGTPRDRESTAASFDVAALASRHAPAHIELSTGEVAGLGQPYDLVVRMNPPRSIGRLAFTVSVDPQLLRVRTVRGGDGSTVDAPSRFIPHDGLTTHQATVEIDLSNAMLGDGNGSIAVVQFETLGPGTAIMIVSDLTLGDLAGSPIPYAASSLTAQTEVLSGPI